MIRRGRGTEGREGRGGCGQRRRLVLHTTVPNHLLNVFVEHTTAAKWAQKRRRKSISNIEVANIAYYLPLFATVVEPFVQRRNCAKKSPSLAGKGVFFLFLSFRSVCVSADLSMSGGGEGG